MKVLKFGLVVTMASCAGIASAEVFDVDGDVSTVTYTPTRKIITFRESGSVTVTGSGEAEVLLVGGGGGGGDLAWKSDDKTSSYPGSPAGGGAGGVVHKRCIQLSAGKVDITVGTGGAIGEKGGKSSAFGLNALGGGSGAKGRGWTLGGDGGSGGGGAEPNGTKQQLAGGSSVYSIAGEEGYQDPDYHGFPGGGFKTGVASVFPAGGGGGAGGAGGDGDDPDPEKCGVGGIGYACSITGWEVYYAGGGGGHTLDDGAKGGLGGGGDYSKAGEDGLGGGGGGYARGGNGIVIISIPIPAYVDSDDFQLSGGDETHHLVDRTYQVFRNDGTLTVTGEGTVELLLVGGGGAGGGFNFSQGGGGGGGGVLHLPSVRVHAGTYAVTVGKGGAGCLELIDGGISKGFIARRGQDGGSSSILGYSVLGGGGGSGGNAKDCTTLTVGGCGGGTTMYYGGSTAYQPGKTAYSGGVSAGYHGFDGGTTAAYDYPAAGGGAGGSPSGEDGAQCAGGVGYVCSITGTAVEYGGGGSTRDSTASGGGGRSSVNEGNGIDGLGGGGAGGHIVEADRMGPGTKGGDGVVIVRYRPTHQDVFDGATGGSVRRRNGYTIHTFTENGTFTMPCPGLVEILLVGGGGGGGEAYQYGQCGAGGGAGGVIHKSSFVIEPGPHDIVVGKGGASNYGDGNSSLAQGGDTVAFGLEALGGGFGQRCLGWGGAGAGASGGGATQLYNGSGVVSGGMGIPGLGNDGGSAVHHAYGGGGGGAGEPGESASTEASGRGGAGYSCAISGATVEYARGGNGGGIISDAHGYGFGGDGGWNNGEAIKGFPGSDGVVIIRYKHPDKGFILLVR